jgi:hypothetical protein
MRLYVFLFAVMCAWGCKKAPSSSISEAPVTGAQDELTDPANSRSEALRLRTPEGQEVLVVLSTLKSHDPASLRGALATAVFGALSKCPEVKNAIDAGAVVSTRMTVGTRVLEQSPRAPTDAPAVCLARALAGIETSVAGGFDVLLQVGLPR